MRYQRSICHAPAQPSARTVGAVVTDLATITLSRDPCAEPCERRKLSTISLSRESRSLWHGLRRHAAITLSRNPIVKNL
jgi:hypothetical protein